MVDSKARMPIAFIGHGNPMHALGDGQWQEGWRQIAQSLPQEPVAIACISAHWMTPQTQVHTGAQPKTIHDFGGFPQELFDVQYPAPGAPEAAHLTLKLLEGAGIQAQADTDWGLDHGTWAVIMHMFPKANVPVFQISLDRAYTPEQFLQLGKALAPLREKGILIVGSGNIVHNLALASFSPKAKTQDWVPEFMLWINARIERGDAHSLTQYHETAAGRTAVNSGEHYYPFLVTVGAALGNQLDDNQLPLPETINAGYELGSVSMHCYLWP